MIKDKLKNLNRYSINNVHFEKLKSLIDYNDFNKLKMVEVPFGKVSLEYQTKAFDLTNFESHRKFIDLHVVFDGAERIGVCNENQMFPVSEYNEPEDYQLWKGKVEEIVTLNSGEFLLLFPGEIHITGGDTKGPEFVRKVVYKLPNFIDK